MFISIAETRIYLIWVLQMDLHIIFSLILGVVLIIAAINDLISKKIPNWLTLPSIFVGISLNSLMHGTEGFLFGLEGMGLGFGLLIFFYILGVMGAGDVKLMTAIGSFVGPQEVFMIFIIATILGAVYAIGLLLINGYFWESVKRYGKILKVFYFTRQIVYVPPSEQEKKLKLCYAVVAALGTAIFKFSGNRIPFI